MIVPYIIGLILAVGLYFFIGVTIFADFDFHETMNLLKEPIVKHTTYVSPSETIKYVMNNVLVISNICIILWPLVLLFMLGCSMGRRLYENLTLLYEEDRIASWFV